jgi:3-oxoacyl-[acyl-carrier protein] reductase
VKADYGRMDVLVNIADFAVFEMVAKMKEEAFQKQFNVNVLGYFLTIREALKHSGETGSIINISSILGTDTLDRRGTDRGHSREDFHNWSHLSQILTA